MREYDLYHSMNAVGAPIYILREPKLKAGVTEPNGLHSMLASAGKTLRMRTGSEAASLAVTAVDMTSNDVKIVGRALCKIVLLFQLAK